MSRYVGGLMLGYGRCGGALDDPEALLDVDVPVFIPGGAACPVDDCVGMLMGGRNAYAAEQRRVPGTRRKLRSAPSAIVPLLTMSQ